LTLPKNQPTVLYKSDNATSESWKRFASRAEGFISLLCPAACSTTTVQRIASQIFDHFCMLKWSLEEPDE